MKDVLITIKTAQTYYDNTKDGMEFSTDGQYSYGKNGAMFSYMESVLTGLEGTKTTFIIRKDNVTMNREGTLTTRMVFEEGKNHRFLYQTPYGAATMGVETRYIRQDLHEEGGELEILYATDLEHNPIGTNSFYITIREQKGTM